MTRARLLVLRPGAFGDVCLLVPVVRELQRFFSVDWLIHERHVAVVRSFPEMTCGLIPLGAKPEHAFAPTEQLASRLRERGYQYVLDFCHWLEVERLVAQLHDVPVRAITRDPVQDELLGIPPRGADLGRTYNRVIDVDPALHQVDKWRTLVGAACGVEINPHWACADRPPPGKIVRIFVQLHASKPRKLWPVARFADVLRDLARRRPIHCYVTAAPRALARELKWRLAFSGCRITTLPIDPTLQKLRDLLRRVDLALGCDSGPMHFAGLLGVPTIVIYGPYPAREFRPWGRTLSISPPRENLDALTISSATVLGAVEEWLNSAEANAAP